MGEIIYQMLVLVFFLTLRHKGTMSADVPQGDTASLNKCFAHPEGSTRGYMQSDKRRSSHLRGNRCGLCPKGFPLVSERYPLGKALLVSSFKKAFVGSAIEIMKHYGNAQNTK